MADQRVRFSPVMIIIFFVLALGLAAFAIRYKVTVFDNSVLLLERWTGEAAIIRRDGTFLRVEKGRALKGPILAPKKYPRDSGAQVVPRIKWRDGTLYSRINIQPYTDALKRTAKDRTAVLLIDLLDGDGFLIYTLRIPLLDMKLQRDEKGKITGLEYMGKHELPRAAYLAIRDWSMRDS